MEMEGFVKSCLYTYLNKLDDALTRAVRVVFFFACVFGPVADSFLCFGQIDSADCWRFSWGLDV